MTKKTDITVAGSFNLHLYYIYLFYFVLYFAYLHSIAIEENVLQFLPQHTPPDFLSHKKNLYWEVENKFSYQANYC